MHQIEHGSGRNTHHLYEGREIWEVRPLYVLPTMRSNDIAQLFLRSSSRTRRTASLAGVMLPFVGLWRLLELRKQVIVFATPRYCTSRVCGPVVDIVRTLIPTYGDRVAFIHEEIWETGGLQKFSPTVEEWNLRSEPWIFVVDGGGMVRARFEGLTTRRELEAALRRALGPKPR